MSNNMWIPNTIYEWLKERIGFISLAISSTKVINDENKGQISELVIALENFKYCKSLYLELLDCPNNIDVNIRFRNIANKLIFDTIYELDKQEYKCIYVHGVCYPTKEKETLLQQNIDYISKLRKALENIFNEVQKIANKTENPTGEKYKTITESLRLMYSDELADEYIRWIITSDISKAYWQNKLNDDKNDN